MCRSCSSLILPFCLFFRPSFRPFVRRSFRPSFRPSFFPYFISSVLSSFRLILFAKHKTHSFFQSFIHRCQHFCSFQDGGKQKPSYTFRLQRVDLLIPGARRACRGWKVQGRTSIKFLTGIEPVTRPAPAPRTRNSFRCRLNKSRRQTLDGPAPSRAH